MSKSEEKTKPDPLLKTDVELAQLISHRLSLPISETGMRSLTSIQGAIGALFIGQHFGLRLLRLLHTSKTLRQYEQFYGAPLETLIPQHGKQIDRSFAWTFIKTGKDYWSGVARKFKITGKDLIDTAPEAQ